MTVGTAPAARGGPADVVYVLTLLQVAAGLLAALGELLLMGGNPIYLPIPLAKAVVLLLLAAKIVVGRRWALITMIVFQGLTVLGFWVSTLIALIPQLGHTVNLVGLLTGVAMPLGISYLCATLLAHVPSRRPSEPAPVGRRAAPVSVPTMLAVDPWPGAPITDPLALPKGVRP